MNQILDEDIDTAITDLKQVIQHQKEQIKNLELVLDQVPGCVYWKDTNGVYLGQNQFSADNLFGHELCPTPDKHYVDGKSDFDIYATEVAKEFRRHDKEVMENNCVMHKEERLSLDDGQQFIQLSTKQPLRDATGHVIGVIGNTVNISYLKKIESQLRQEKEASESQSERLKDHFVQNMEHDIRTPLNGIVGMTEKLIDSESEPARKKVLHEISSCAHELISYINAVLDYTKIEKGTSPVIVKKFSLRDLVERILQIERPAANNKKLELLLEWSSDVPDVVLGDDYRLYRLLVNLLSNAIKFTNSGYVKLMIKVVSQVDKRVVIQFVIKDTGIGIPKDKQNYIYEKFSRLQVADHSAERRGIGLGLRVVKQFIDELSGDIELESHPNIGSTFVCSIPFELPLVNTLTQPE